MTALNRSRGAGTRYDNDGGGNHIARLREAPVSTFTFSKRNLRFCETCRNAKECDRSVKAVKGWKCKDCASA